jgi:hypothetical protein
VLHQGAAQLGGERLQAGVVAVVVEYKINVGDDTGVMVVAVF